MGGTKHKYYIHEDGGIGMNSLQSQSKIGASKDRSSKNLYDVRVTTRGMNSSRSGIGMNSSRGSKSDEEIVKADSDSSEDIWPLQGIKKTVDVSVS